VFETTIVVMSGAFGVSPVESLKVTLFAVAPAGDAPANVGNATPAAAVMTTSPIRERIRNPP
jgi:hypothetical protein